MDIRKRALLLCVISLVGGSALFINDLIEHGWSLGILGWPVLLLGLVVIPSLKDIKKNQEK